MSPENNKYNFRFTSNPTKNKFPKQPKMIDNQKPTSQGSSDLDGIKQLNIITMRYGLLSDDFCIFTSEE